VETLMEIADKVRVPLQKLVAVTFFRREHLG
jgi:hypothetical protein